MESHYTVGFAGHVDHGKTTLVQCLTGVDTDRKPEEKRRGMSIEAGVAPIDLPSGRRAAVIDVPGHSDFLKNTIRGLNGVDLGVLVVAADDGVMPQTREHLEILKCFKASAGLVVLSKTDLVDRDTLELAELEIRELLGGTFLQDCPLVQFSAKQPELSCEVARGIDAVLAKLPARAADAPFRLWVDQIRNLAGHGTVVSGTVSSGVIHCDDDIQLLPSGHTTRARALKSHGNAIAQAVAGQRVGINLHRVSPREIERGMALAAPGAVAPAVMLNTEMRVLNHAAKGITSRRKVKIYLGTAMVSAMIIVMDGDRLDPGQSGLVQLRLLKPVAAWPQDAFVVTPLNINSVIAGGRVLEVSREKYRESKAGAMLPLLSALQRTDVNAYVAQVFSSSPGHLITAKDLALRTGLPYADFESLIGAKVQKKELVYIKGRGAIQADHLAAVKARFLAVVEEAFRKDPLKKAILLPEVAERMQEPIDPLLLQITADALRAAGKLIAQHGGYYLPDVPGAHTEQHTALMTALMEYAGKSGVTPFSADTYWKEHQKRQDKPEIQRMLNHLFARKKLVRLNDNRFLSVEALDEIKKRVSHAIQAKGFMTVGDCKEVLGYGRWGGTHVLDYLNAIGFTVRREDRHYLKKA